MNNYFENIKNCSKNFSNNSIEIDISHIAFIKKMSYNSLFIYNNNLLSFYLDDSDNIFFKLSQIEKLNENIPVYYANTIPEAEKILYYDTLIYQIKNIFEIINNYINLNLCSTDNFLKYYSRALKIIQIQIFKLKVIYDYKFLSVIDKFKIVGTKKNLVTIMFTNDIFDNLFEKLDSIMLNFNEFILSFCSESSPDLFMVKLSLNIKKKKIPMYYSYEPIFSYNNSVLVFSTYLDEIFFDIISKDNVKSEIIEYENEDDLILFKFVLYKKISDICKICMNETKRQEFELIEKNLNYFTRCVLDYNYTMQLIIYDSHYFIECKKVNSYLN